MDAHPQAWESRYLGIPHRYRGRNLAGCDCWGLARLILNDRFAVDLPCFADLAPDPDDFDAIEACLLAHLRALAWRKVNPSTETTGDLVLLHVLFRDSQRGFRVAIAHLGLVLVPGTLIHVEQGGVATIARYRGDGHDRVLARRIAGFRRHPELADGQQPGGGGV